MPLPESLLKNYAKFQAKNDIPVHLKGGPMDKVLFGITIGFCVIGVAQAFHMAYVMGFKRKEN